MCGLEDGCFFFFFKWYSSINIQVNLSQPLTAEGTLRELKLGN